MGTSNRAIILIIICTILTSSAQVLFKFGSVSFSFNPILLIQNYFVIFGFLCYALGALLFILALKEGDLSTIYPFFTYLSKAPYKGAIKLNINLCHLSLSILNIIFY